MDRGANIFRWRAFKPDSFTILSFQFFSFSFFLFFLFRYENQNVSLSILRASIKRHSQLLKRGRCVDPGSRLGDITRMQ